MALSENAQLVVNPGVLKKLGAEYKECAWTIGSGDHYCAQIARVQEALKQLLQCSTPIVPIWGNMAGSDGFYPRPTTVQPIDLRN